jgi:hypothetical protein
MIYINPFWAIAGALAWLLLALLAWAIIAGGSRRNHD